MDNFTYSQSLPALWLDECRKAYLECALWADIEEELSGKFSVYDSTRETYEQAGWDILEFVKACRADGLDVVKFDAEDVGHNLWLSRVGHGTGFWDVAGGRCDWHEEQGELMHKHAKALGSSVSVFSTDDGKQWMIE